MKNKRKTRFIVKAAHLTVEAIERNGLKCVLVGPIARYLHGSKTVLEDVSLITIGTNSDGYPTPESISEVLQNSYPFHFRKADTSNLRYYDFVSGREHFCSIRLLRVEKPFLIFNDDIIRIRNMPVPILIYLLIEHLRTLFAYLEKPGNRDLDCSELSSQIITLNNLLLTVNGRTLSASSNVIFNQEASSLLRRALDVLPQSSCELLSAILFAPAIVPAAGSFGSISSPNLPENHITNAAFVDSLDEIDSNQGNVQLHNSSRPEDQIDPRVQTICRIAKTVVGLLRNLNIECALFGSTACWLYGNPRVPNDIDLLAFPPQELSKEELKQSIQEQHPRFRLERSANPDAPFKILYFHLDEINGFRGFFPGNKCKIDILLPGILHLPHLSGSQISQLGGLPVVPFSVLLLQKLQGWDDHRKLRWTYPKKYAKASIDARDLQHLLTLEEHVAPLKESQPWNDSLFTEEFKVLSHQRARDFCGSFPDCRQHFELLGILVDLKTKE